MNFVIFSFFCFFSCVVTSEDFAFQSNLFVPSKTTELLTNSREDSFSYTNYLIEFDGKKKIFNFMLKSESTENHLSIIDIDEKSEMDLCFGNTSLTKMNQFGGVIGVLDQKVFFAYKEQIDDTEKYRIYYYDDAKEEEKNIMKMVEGYYVLDFYQRRFKDVLILYVEKEEEGVEENKRMLAFLDMNGTVNEKMELDDISFPFLLPNRKPGYIGENCEDVLDYIDVESSYVFLGNGSIFIIGEDLEISEGENIDFDTTGEPNEEFDNYFLLFRKYQFDISGQKVDKLMAILVDITETSTKYFFIEKDDLAIFNLNKKYIPGVNPSSNTLYFLEKKRKVIKSTTSLMEMETTNIVQFYSNYGSNPMDYVLIHYQDKVYSIKLGSDKTDIYKGKKGTSIVNILSFIEGTKILFFSECEQLECKLFLLRPGYENPYQILDSKSSLSIQRINFVLAGDFREEEAEKDYYISIKDSSGKNRLYTVTLSTNLECTPNCVGDHSQKNSCVDNACVCLDDDQTGHFGNPETSIKDCSVCSPDYFGEDCKTFCSREETCNGNGICVENSKGAVECSCDTFFEGDYCDRCEPGRNISKNCKECFPIFDFRKNKCVYIECDGISQISMKSCGINGQCRFDDSSEIVLKDGLYRNEGKCTCRKGYAGGKCNRFFCDGVSSNSSSTCNGRGVCKSPEQCECNDGYSGEYCETASLRNFWVSFMLIVTFSGLIVICSVVYLVYAYKKRSKSTTDRNRLGIDDLGGGGTFVELINEEEDHEEKDENLVNENLAPKIVLQDHPKEEEEEEEEEVETKIYDDKEFGNE